MITKAFSTKNSFLKFITLLFFSFFMFNFLNLIVIKFSIIILGSKGFHSVNIFFTSIASVFAGGYFFLFAKKLETVIKIGKETKYFTLKDSINRVAELELPMQLLLFSIVILMFTVMSIFTLGLSLYIYSIFQSKIVVFLFIVILIIGISSYILAIVKSQQFLHLKSWGLPWKR